MAAKKKSWYAVRAGRKPGLYRTWEECRKQVIGFGGAAYKGFYTEEEARAFLAPAEASPAAHADGEGMTVYVDGSFMPFLPDRYGYGVVFLHEGKVETASHFVIDRDSARMRNVAGEVKGAMYAMETCRKRGISHMDLYYDYAGIEKWCTGEWKANLPGTKALKTYYDSVKGELSVSFHKVKSHTGVRYNEMADRLAKGALLRAEKAGEKAENE